MRAHEEDRQSEHKAIEHGEIGRTPSGAIADQQLMLEQERLSCNSSHATRAEGFREGNEQMDRQDEQISHDRKLSRRPICTRLHLAAIHIRNLRIRHPHAQASNPIRGTFLLGSCPSTMSGAASRAITVTRATRSIFAGGACAASSHASAPRNKVMNLRRIMELSCRGLGAKHNIPHPATAHARIPSSGADTAVGLSAGTRDFKNARVSERKSRGASRCCSVVVP
jgi:hypothetical protein